MPIQDYAAHPPGVETPGYRLKPVKTGSGDVAGLDHRIHARGLITQQSLRNHDWRDRLNKRPPTSTKPIAAIGSGTDWGLLPSVRTITLTPSVRVAVKAS
jgi:hypothetical protein